MLGRLAAWFAQLPENLPGYVDAAWAAIKSAFAKGVVLVIQAGQSVYNTLKEWFGKVPELALEMGEGIVSHLKQLPGRLLSAAVNIGASIWKGFRDGIDKKSPSGPEKDIIAMAKGMEVTLEQAVPKLSEKAQKLGDAVAKHINDGLKSVGIGFDVSLKEILSFSDQWRKKADELGDKARELAETKRQVGLVIALSYDFARKTFDEYLKKVKEGSQTIIKDHADVGKSVRDMSSLEGAAHAAAIEAWLAHERAADETADAIKRSTEEIAAAISKNLRDEFQRLSNELPQSWNKIIDGILNGSGRLGDELLKLGVKVKGWAADIIGVVGTLPGKFGDAARGVLSTVDTWIQFADRVLAVLHRINSSIPGSIEDMISVITGGMTKAQKTVEAVLDDIFGPVIKNASTLDTILDEVFGPAEGIGSAMNTQAGQVERSSSRMVNAISAIGTAAAFAGAAIGGRTGAVLSGAGAGASLGAQIGFVFGGPMGAGIGTVVGAAAGAIAGWLGSAKSDLQKAQEAAALQQAKDAVKISMQNALQAVEQTKQSLLDTVAKARDIIESIRFHTSIGKEPMRAFFKDLHQFMTRLAQEASTWKGFASSETKKAIEDLSAGVDLIAKIPAALFAIATHFKVPQTQFDVFFSDLDRFFDGFAKAVEDWSAKQAKKIKKMAGFLAPAVDLVSPLTEAMKAMLDLKDVPDAAFNTLEGFLDTLANRFGELATKMDKGVLKAVEFFASKVAPVVDLSKSTIDLIKSAVGVTVPSEADIENVFSSLTAFINRAVQMSKEVNTEGLLFATAVAQAIVPMASGLKSWLETSVLAKDYTAIGADVWQAIVDDFKRGLAMLHLLLADALLFVDDAKKFDALVKEGNQFLASGLSGFVTGLQNAASMLGGALNNLNVNTSFGSGLSASSFATGGGGSSVPSSALSSAGAPPPAPVTVHITVEGSVHNETSLQNAIIQGLETAFDRGRFSPA